MSDSGSEAVRWIGMSTCFSLRRAPAGQTPTPSSRSEMLPPSQRHSVDVESGERRAFDSPSGVDLIDAVAASGAVPGIWPPVALGGRRYMDGGVYSSDNADLAVGCDHVLILTLPARVPPLCAASLETAVDELRSSGARVDVVHPDEVSQAAFASVGGNLLDPSVREAAACAGREQGRRFAARRVRQANAQTGE